MSKGGSHLKPKNVPSKSSSLSARKTTNRQNSESEYAYERKISRNQDVVTVEKKHASGKKIRKRSGSFRSILLIILIAVFLFSGYMLVHTLLGYKQSRSEYSALQDEAIVIYTPRPVTISEEYHGDDEPEEEKTESEIPLQVKWEKLQSINSDIVAWIYFPDSIINYPIVQTGNNDTYIYQSFQGTESSNGTLFADCGSSIGQLSSHLIIYGHNMKDNSMFGTLKNYVDESYYEEHPVFYILTPQQSYRVELLDCQTIEAVTSNYPTYFSGNSLSEYVNRLTSSAYWVNKNADYEQYQLVTLSTCTSGDNYRLILQGVMIPIE